jgi:glucosamine--fructose-6-phosphate aminotransferase (isomerizing)
MADASSDRAVMRDQIASQPALLRDLVEPATRQVADALRGVQPQGWQAIYTAGCGDSFHAGLACEMAFARFCRLPVKALAAMPFARYEAARAPTPAGLFGISNSGEVARSIEAVALARAAGMDTVAVTGRAGSGIAREAAATVAVPVPAMGRAPGIRSYTVQLVSLLLCALRVGELRQVLTAADADRWRQRLAEVADCMAATLEAADLPARQAAERLGSDENWVFLGSGPSYATALFSAAKLVESCGANAWGQDVEEWGHIQFFNAQERTPTCLIVPSGRSLDRGLELLPHIKAVGRHTLAVAYGEPASLPLAVDTFLPVPNPVPELFTPLVYCLAGELLAYHLAEVRCSRFFQPTGGVSGAGDRLRESRILRRLDKLPSD